jgi:hypothetical protein
MLFLRRNVTNRMSFRRLKSRPSDQDGRPERRTGAEGPLLRTSPPAPPLFGLSSRGRVLTEGSVLDLPHMVPRPGMASLPGVILSAAKDLSEGVLPRASPAGKSHRMNTYTIHPLNSFGMRTYATRLFTSQKWQRGCISAPEAARIMYLAKEAAVGPEAANDISCGIPLLRWLGVVC